MSSRQFMVKVPEISIFFWLIKVLSTAMGESTSDYLVAVMNPIVAVLLGFIAFVVVLVIQFRADRYIPWLYWLTVLMVAIFGTMAADVLHIGFGVPYFVSSTFFAVALVLIFALWYGTERTLSIHSITTFRREVFYWATVVTTFALGTAVGDMTAVTFALGYLSSGILFAGLIALVAALHYGVKAIMSSEHHPQSANVVLAFWLAYILTRPLGASFADWAGKSHAVGALGYGDGAVSLVLGVLIFGLVWYLSRAKNTQAG